MSFSLRASRTSRRLILMAFSLVAISLPLTGCDLFKNELKIDRSGNKEFQEYRDAFAPRPIPVDDTKMQSDSTIPALQSYVAQPSDNLRAMPLVSISVNQTVPLRDALFELAKQTNYDLELDPRITGSIIFTAREQPLDSVVERISNMAGLRYKFDGNVLRVEVDSAYHENYKIDYLSYIRKTSSAVNNNSSLATTSDGGSGNGGAAAGSSYTTSSESEANFWGELQTNLQQILGVPTGAGAMVTGADPQITATASNPAPVAPVVTQGADGKTNVTVQPPQATLQVSSLPPSTGTPAATAPASTPSFSLNKQAGIVSVYATQAQHKQIRDYLKQLRRSVTAQVLIEAKVMEVNLSDEFASGIEWNRIISGLSGRVQITPGTFTRPDFPSPAISSFTLGVGGGNQDQKAVVDAIQRYGVVKALSSPRLAVLNNQSAVLNVATNQVYFTLQVQTQQGTNGSGNLTTINSTPHNVPEGVLINVQPSIDLDNKTISMSIRPTVTRITGTVSDPAAQAQGVVSTIPVVNVQEMDSILNMQSGQAVIMGGLMQDRAASQQEGIPILSEVPGFGAIFRNQVDHIQKTELVIFMKATIIDADGASPDGTDRDMYKTFADDRRPFKM